MYLGSRLFDLIQFVINQKSNVAKSSLFPNIRSGNSGPQGKGLTLNKFSFTEQNKFVQGIYQNQFEDENGRAQRRKRRKEKRKRVENNDY